MTVTLPGTLSLTVLTSGFSFQTITVPSGATISCPPFLPKSMVSLASGVTPTFVSMFLSFGLKVSLLFLSFSVTTNLPVTSSVEPSGYVTITLTSFPFGSVVSFVFGAGVSLKVNLVPSGRFSGFLTNSFGSKGSPCFLVTVCPSGLFAVASVFAALAVRVLFSVTFAIWS